jgi:hypothetical protein
MSELIAAKAKGDLLERYEEERETLDEDATESELVRDLLERGLDARQLPLYTRIGFSDRLASQLENERPAGVSEEEMLREVAEGGLRARRGDVLDAIDASDELREAVEARREDSEPLDDAVRRLLRQGIAATADREPTSRARLAVALYAGTLPASALALTAAAGVVAGWAAGAVVGVATIVTWAAAIAYADVVAGAFVRLQERVGVVLGGGGAGGA